MFLKQKLHVLCTWCKKKISFILLLMKVCGRLHTWQGIFIFAAAVLQLDSGSFQEITGLNKHTGLTVITSAF